MHSRKEISGHSGSQLKPLLEKWVRKIERPSFIKDDPVQFMYRYDGKEDRELAGFFAAIMAWGRRDIVNRKVNDLLSRMDHRPAEFIAGFRNTDAERFEGFKHRTFKPVDIYWLVTILHRILDTYGSFERFWQHCHEEATAGSGELTSVFYRKFFTIGHDAPDRTHKHISSAEKNSACKRLYLFLRWTIRNGSPVDPGTMSFMKPSELKIPLDVHVARQAREMGLLHRSYNDWKATVELTDRLRQLDPADPAKYDFALFGLGMAGKS